MMALFLVVSLALPDQAVAGRRVVFSGFTEIARQPVWMAFAASVFIIWLAATGLNIFLNIYLKGLGSSDQLIGFTFAAAALAELPVMAFSSLLLRRIGAVRLVVIGFLGFAVRMFFFSSLTNPAWGPAVALLNGVSYVPFIIGGVAYASELAPDHLKATSQGLLYAIMNLSAVVGGLFCGWLYDLTGPVRLYQVLAAACVVGAALFIGGQYGFRKMKAVESE
jgi:MFS family permease